MLPCLVCASYELPIKEPVRSESSTDSSLFMSVKYCRILISPIWTVVTHRGRWTVARPLVLNSVNSIFWLPKIVWIGIVTFM